MYFPLDIPKSYAEPSSQSLIKMVMLPLFLSDNTELHY